MRKFSLIICLLVLIPLHIWGQANMINNVKLSSQHSKNNSIINFIDSYVNHINLSLNDHDDFSDDEINSINVKKGFKNNTSQKEVIYRNNEIVKVKYREYLDHNFIKMKTFYYNHNHLVCIKINELVPDKKSKVKNYRKTLYYFNDRLVLNANQSDSKYNSSVLLKLANQKLKEEYQSKVND
ncbi:MAG: hypothetical protein ACWA42_02815 [Lutibacter sp.]